MAGLETEYSGIISIDEEKLNGYREDTTMVFQDFSLFPWRTVKRNVLFPMEQHRHEKKDFENKVNQLLRLIGLSQKANDFPDFLSGGQMQRVAFARALAVTPRLILLDEPFSSLDIHTRETLQEEISDIFQYTGVTAIMVTHDITEAIFMADRIEIMRPGGHLTKEYTITVTSPRRRDFRN